MSIDSQKQSPKLSIAVLSWNSLHITKECIDSIIKNVHGVSYEIILIDNASHDGSAEMIQQQYDNSAYPHIHCIYNSSNLGFAGGNNQAFELACGEYFLLLNSDTIVYPGSIEAMVKFLDANANYAAATTKLLNPDGSIQYYMHREFPSVWKLVPALFHKRFRWFKPKIVRDYLYLDNKFTEDFDIQQAAGANLMVRSNIIHQNGVLLDDKHFPIYYNDVDLCYRLHQSGYNIRCINNIGITHLKGTSVRKLDFFKNGKEYTSSSLGFFKKHGMWPSYWLLKFLYLVLFSCLLVAKPTQSWGTLKVIFSA